MKKLILVNALCGGLLLAGTTMMHAQDETESLATQMGMLKAQEIEGQNVWNLQKEKVGDIDHLLIDYAGNVRFAVLSVGGFLGVGDRMIVVPWSAIRVGGKPAGSEASFFLDADKERLKQAPVYDPATYAELFIPANAKPIYVYWDVKVAGSDSKKR